MLRGPVTSTAVDKAGPAAICCLTLSLFLLLPASYVLTSYGMYHAIVVLRRAARRGGACCRLAGARQRSGARLMRARRSARGLRGAGARESDVDEVHRRFSRRRDRA